MSKELEELQEMQKTLKNLDEKYSREAEKALNEAKKWGDISAKTKEDVDKIASDYNALAKKVNDVATKLGEAEKLYAELPTNGGRGRVQTVRDLIMNSAGAKAFAADPRTQRNANIAVPRNALTTSGLPGLTVMPDRVPGTLQTLKSKLFIRDLIAPGQTGSNAVSYVKITGFTNAAAAVAENTAKPYSSLTYTNVLTAVKTIAHMFKVSKQALEDFDQLVSDLEVEMNFGLKQVEETEILFGDGTGSHLDGIYHQASAFDAGLGVSGNTVIDVLRLAMLQAQLAKIPATGMAIHMTDWTKEIELKKDSLGRYIVGDPSSNDAPSLWGLPAAITDAEGLVGKFLVGSFALGAQIYDREDANIVMSSENVDDFEKNMISVRCEERLALAVKRPEAFIKGDMADIA